MLSVQRNGEILIPSGDTLLRRGDRLTLIGAEHNVAEALARIGA